MAFETLTVRQDGWGRACASLLHGIPSSPLLTAICLGHQEVTPFSFSTRLGTRPGKIRVMSVNPRIMQLWLKLEF